MRSRRLLLASDPAFAQTPRPTRTIQDLYAQCTSGNPLDGLLCMNYLQGVAETMQLNSVVILNLAKTERLEARISPLIDCSPGGVTGGATVQIFINWAAQHPEEWSEPKAVGALQAFHEGWSCPR